MMETKRGFIMPMSCFVKFSGDRSIQGGVTEPGYGGWFEALAWKPVEVNARRRDCRSRGSVRYMQIALPLDSFSSQLMYANGTFRTVQMHMVKTGPMPQLVMEVKMCNARIIMCSNSGDRLAVNVSCDTMEIHYYQYDLETGKLMPSTPGYDLKQQIAM